MLTHLGVKLVHSEGRSLRVDHEVVDAAKFARVFGDGMNVHFVSTRLKDMPGLIAQGTLDGTVLYSVVMDNFPTASRLIVSVLQTDISLAPIRRRGGEQIDARMWTADKPPRIAVEDPRMVQTFLLRLDVPQDMYKIEGVLGASELYLLYGPYETYLLYDAIIITSCTLQANNREVW
jgi:ATP phosphoribosyltransferase